MKGKDHLEDADIYRRIIIKYLTEMVHEDTFMKPKGYLPYS
jgi:hypothetical protein